MRRRLGLAIVVGALIGATVVLHRLAVPYPISAFTSGPLEVALAAAARLVGLGVAYWLLASTVLYLLAWLARLPRTLKAISWFTWRPLRRMIDGGLASGVVMAMAIPVYASVAPGYVPIPASDPVTEPPTTTVPVATTYLTTTTAATATEATTTPIDILYLPIEPLPAAVPVATVDPQTIESEHVVVMPGDNMWLLAERRLVEALGRQAGDHEVAPYWLAVIGANKDRIRSGDPDLIFPGEVLILPAWHPG